jgi:Carboxypeptidase regulatory-like domain/TonB dependent receptor
VRRFPVSLLVLVIVLAATVLAQSPNGTVSGLVVDPSGRVIADVEVLVVNDSTGVKYPATTNTEGIYFVPNLPPGPYRVQVSKPGFKTLIKPDIVLNVQGALAINFTLPIGSVAETVTVESGTTLVDTRDAAVSTVVDHTYVQNMPLNGRSFQDLILLTPGVVTNSPQTTGTVGASGEFSVSGQRTESNYYTVDGVSANLGVFPGVIYTPGASGSLASSTSLGTTQALVPVDALQEFRTQTSSYSAEYGRNPGGQFSLLTRSGSNDRHGTLFDYLRNDIFDANDWFNDFFRQPLPALRQNDFGGTWGGPVEIPKLYDGKERTFFFFSYEGLRLIQPQAASISYVPTASVRQSAAPALQPVLNAFPVVNCTPAVPNCVADLGNGLGEFVGSWPNPSQIDSVGVRFDEVLNKKVALFFRFSDTSSSSHSRETGIYFASPSNLSLTSYDMRTYTAGVSTFFSSRVSSELRFNYSSNDATNAVEITSFGGSQAINLVQAESITSSLNPTADVMVGLEFGTYLPAVTQSTAYTLQRQWNLVESLSWSTGRHELKFGADYRRLSPVGKPNTPTLYLQFNSPASLQGNSVDIGEAMNNAPAFPVYTNLSLYAEDEWRLSPDLNLSMGLRWEVNPAPGSAKGPMPYSVTGADDLSTMTLAPAGTPLWKTSWFNFAPRLGVAYVIHRQPGTETVVRGGGGVFFDTGQQLGSLGYQGPGFSAFGLFGSELGTPASFPVSVPQVVPSIINPPVAPYTSSLVVSFPSHMQLPYTWQWNASIEQSLGKSQALTTAYVAARGRRLLEENGYDIPESVNSNFSGVVLVRNGLTSSYDALQVKFQRRLTAGLQALASYTWSHAIDYGSQNTDLPYLKGNSDFDVRHSLSGAISYDLPGISRDRLTSALSNGWGLDTRVSARTAFPVNLAASPYIDPATGQNLISELNLVPEQPIYLWSDLYPGGRSINPSAFSPATPGQAGDAPRNFVRGFNAWQIDLAARRNFRLPDQFSLQFRAEAFNILNHPNFGSINTNYCSTGPGCTFGQSIATLAQSLGVLSPLYQMGGPRSLQFALKLQF